MEGSLAVVGKGLERERRSLGRPRGTNASVAALPRASAAERQYRCADELRYHDKILSMAYLLTLACAHPVATTGESQDAVRGESRNAVLEEKKRQYAAYFNTIKAQVHAKWAPAQPMRNLDPDGTRFGVEARQTLLWIALAPDGAISDLRIQQKSGVELLDEIAVSAFRAAAPFPKAPPKLVINGRIRFCIGFNVSPSNRQSGLQTGHSFRFFGALESDDHLGRCAPAVRR
jgi:TonB family protein